MGQDGLTAAIFAMQHRERSAPPLRSLTAQSGPLTGRPSLCRGFLEAVIRAPVQHCPVDRNHQCLRILDADRGARDRISASSARVGNLHKVEAAGLGDAMEKCVAP
jgi:hypothetical protein